MKTVVIPADKLSEELVLRWSAIQQHNASLYSPFFRPEFAKAVAAVRDDVFVAIIDDGTAFFPFQRDALGLGQPVGGPISDCHGLISASDFRCDVVALMKACRLWNWNFDHVPAEQTMFAPWRTLDSRSPVVDVEQGAVLSSTGSHSDHRGKAARLRRRLERDYGQVEVEWKTTDPSALEFCLKWKSAQYHRTRTPDLFGRSWARSLVEVIASQHKTEFAGMLSVLRAGGQPIAAHLGMRSNNVCHYWFPTYDPQFHRYSPGILLLLEIMAEAPQHGINLIDLGKGDSDYKLRIANRMVPLIEGSVVTLSPVFQIVRVIASLKRLAKRSPKLKSILAPGHRLYQKARLRVFWLIPAAFSLIGETYMYV